jgi:hypothetical protein
LTTVLVDCPVLALVADMVIEKVPAGVEGEAVPKLVVIVMVTVAVSWLADGELKLQLAPAGKPLHEKVIAPKPGLESTVKSIEVVLPAATSRLPPLGLITIGGPIRKVLTAEPPVPAFAEVTGPVMLSYVAFGPVTLTLMVQELLAAMAAPDKLIVPDAAAAVIVPPPHEPVSPLGVATTKFPDGSPAGSVSVNPTPVSATGFTLVIVKERADVLPAATLEGTNISTRTGGPKTTILAVAVPPVPPSVELMVPVVLTWFPELIPVTLMENEHEPFGGNVPPERVTKDWPEMLPVCAVPPHAPKLPTVGVIDTPLGKVSPNAIPVSATVGSGLVILNVRLVVPRIGMVAAPNALAMVGGPTTAMEAFAVLPVPPLEEVTVTLLFFTPGVVPVTFTENAQEAFWGNRALDRLTEDEPAVAVIAQPQAPINPFGVATTKPEGKLSVKATPVNETPFAAGLVIVKLREVEPFVNGILAAPNDVTMVGGVPTVRDAEAALPLPPSVELTGPVVLR